MTEPNTDGMKRLLFLVPRYGNTSTGEQNVINARKNYLEKRGYKIQICVLALPFYRKTKAYNVQEIRLSILDIFLGFLKFLTDKTLPLEVALYSSPTLIKKVDEYFMKQEIGGVFIFQLRLFELGRYLNQKKKIFEFIDSVSLLLDRSSLTLYRMIRGRCRISKYEKDFNADGLKVFISIIDKEYLSLPNSVVVPLQEYRNPKAQPGREKTYDLVFIGNMHYRPNKEGLDFFLSDIYPRLLNDNVVDSMLILGKGSEKFKNPRRKIVGKGYVDDLDSLISLARVSVAPVLTGAGMQTKVVRSLINGVPVVGTDRALDPYLVVCRELQGLYLADRDYESWRDSISKAYHSRINCDKRLLEYLNDERHSLAIDNYLKHEVALAA